MKRFYMVLVLTAALLVSACGQKESPIIYPTPELTNDWTVSMTQTGGIMGLQRTIEVNADGSYTVTDSRNGDVVTGTLAADEIGELKGLVTSIKFAAPELQSNCADCFLYDINIQSNGQKLIIQADDVTLLDSGVEALVSFLRGKIEAAMQ